MGGHLRGPHQADFEPDGAGGRNRTADLPLTRRLLCQLSYAGPRSVYRSACESAPSLAAILVQWTVGRTHGVARLA